ncbi:hypothetical protein KV699_12530 [Vreelandella titanicae]|uniref:hypothetical protein n=1 Tax=Vreelandella titanicae TaxID=664683 RepID=UPI003BB21FE8
MSIKPPMKYPLSAWHSIPESSKFLGYTMSGPDPYHEKSRMTLAEHIEEAKSFLQITYCSGNYHDKDQPEEKQISAFLEEYQAFFQALKGGQNATSCEELITMKLGAAFQSDKLQGCFSTSMTWVLCTELLYQSEYTENAWSTLVEYKKSELETERALEEEYNLSVSNRNRAAGKLNHQERRYLKPYFAELLVSETPNNGWKAMKTAASKLAPLIFERHMSSGTDADPDTTEADVETWLTTWLKNDEQCKKLYFAHRHKKP